MRDAHLNALLRRNGRLYPKRPALVCDDRIRTHAELLSQAARTANVYAAAGAEPGDRVAVIARNSIEMVEALCACELGGTIAVPLNHRLADAELAIIVRDCTPKLLVADVEFEATARALCEAAARPLQLFLIGGPDGEASLEGAVSIASDELPAPPRPADTAYIIYTSGSTGRPKGVMLSHQGLVESGRLLASPAGVRPDSAQIVVMPLFHVGATSQRMGYLVHGGTLVLHRKFEAERIVEELASGRVTDIHLAPTMLRSVLDAVGDRTLDFSRLETVKYASSPIPEDTLARAMRVFGPKLIQYYALTEAGGIGTALHKFVHAEAMQGIGVERLRSAGQSHLSCEIELRHPDGRVCGPGEEGEIWLRSPALMSGYWANPELTRDALVDGWLRTSDAARFDAERYLFIMDRLKDMIVSGGENIYSTEVERALEAHPHVLETAVIGIPDTHWGESVHAVVVMRPGAPPLSDAELIEFCKGRLASYKKPRSIAFVDALPRLQHVQKIDKNTLRRPFWGDRKRSVN